MAASAVVSTPVDEPGLAADLGHVPAGERRDPAGERHRDQRAGMQRPGLAGAAAAASAAIHDTSSIRTPTPTMTRKAKNTGATGGCLLERRPGPAPRRPSCASGSARPASGSRSRSALCAPPRPGSRTAPAAAPRSVFHSAFHRRDLGGLVLERVEAVQVADEDLHRDQHRGEVRRRCACAASDIGLAVAAQPAVGAEPGDQEGARSGPRRSACARGGRAATG